MNDARTRQIERIREMSANEKVRLSHALWLQAWNAAAAGVRARHPKWTEAEVAQRVRALMRDAGP
jgi:hypothetical protein